MYRKLSKDIDISALNSMRSSGMSNRQIADRIGVSTVTVRKYIGNQPRGLRMSPGSYLYSKECGGEVEQKPVSNKPSLSLISSRLTLKGDCNDYVVDTASGTVEVSGLLTGLLDKQTISKFANELNEIMLMLDPQATPRFSA